MMTANKNRLRIGIIFGGRSGEHEVSLMSARSVLNALDPGRYDVIQIGITKDGAWLVGDNLLDMMDSGAMDDLSGQVTAAAILPDPTSSGLYLIRSDKGELFEHMVDLDVVFPVLHGTFGEDGTLQGMLEMADLAYVGAGVVGSAVGMDKGIFKDVMRANGIPVVEWLIVLRSDINKDIQSVMDEAEDLAPYPLFVKPANLGSSVGITICRSRGDLIEGLMEAARYDRRVLIERAVNAREIEISVLGNEHPQASIPGEVLPSREFYSYESKYVDGTSGLLIPAPLTEKTAARVRELAIKAYEAIDCAGMARVDFLLEKDDALVESGEGLYLNEANTIPGFTEISMYPKLWDASGLPYPDLVDRLIQLALERKSDRDTTERKFRGSG